MYLNNHNCYNSGSDVVAHGQCSCLEMQWLESSLAGHLEKNRAQYVNVLGSVHWGGGECIV